jgi:hypothetical protein
VSDLATVIAGLEEERDRCRQVADLADEAIAAMGKLRAALAREEPVPARAALPAPPAPPPPPAPRQAKAAAVDRHGHRVYGAARPRTATCRNEPCGKEFATKGTGRVPHYCSDVCRRARGKRQRRAGAAPAGDLDELLRPPDTIPESGDAMRDRIRRAAKVGRTGPTFLDRARERNDEAARRNGVGRAS